MINKNFPYENLTSLQLHLPRMLDDRIRFCGQYGHLTEEQWMSILFLDESTFRVTVKISSYWVRWPCGSDRFDPRYTFRKNRQLVEITVWGCTYLRTWQRSSGLSSSQNINEH